MEWATPEWLVQPGTNLNGQVSFAEASRRWAERDGDTLRQIANALAGDTDVAEAKSWIWPRASIEFKEIVARDRDSDSVRSAPSGGLVLHYDFEKLVFHSDAAAVAQAGRDLNLQKARLAIDSAILKFHALVMDWYQLQNSAPIEEQRATEFARLMEAVHSLDLLGALPPGSFAEWKHREQSAQRERAELARRLANCRQLLQTELGLAGNVEPDFGSLEFLLEAPPLPGAPAGEGEAQSWLPGVWRAHPACRVAELELFRAEMGVIDAKRERLPRLSGSIGLGAINTWVGDDIVEASGVAEIGMSLPLFDAGTISRRIDKAGLYRDLARRNVGVLARALVRDAQTALATLRTALWEADHRRAEAQEAKRLAELAGRGSALGQGDPLLPFALRIYALDAELGAWAAKVNLAKAWWAYQGAVGELPVPGLATGILDDLVRGFPNSKYAAKN